MLWARLAGSACLLFVLATGSVMAEDREVTGDEIAALLTGNSIDGMWGETHYIQYFAESGRTLYKADGSPGDWGTWRVDDDGHYCSTWRGGEEICYLVIEMDDAYAWRAQEGDKTYPFEIIEGDATGPETDAIIPDDATGS